MGFTSVALFTMGFLGTIAGAITGIVLYATKRVSKHTVSILIDDQSSLEGFCTTYTIDQYFSFMLGMSIFLLIALPLGAAVASFKILAKGESSSIFKSIYVGTAVVLGGIYFALCIWGIVRCIYFFKECVCTRS